MFGRDEKVSAIRLTASQYIVVGIFLILVYGLWRLQVMQSDYYSLAAEKNRVRNVPVLAPRGKILDREGRVPERDEGAGELPRRRRDEHLLSAESPLLDQRSLDAELRARELSVAIGLVRALGGGFEASTVALAREGSR